MYLYLHSSNEALSFLHSLVPYMDKHGCSPGSRARFLSEIISSVRANRKPGFQISLCRSRYRYGVPLTEMRDVAARAMHEEIDYLDLAASRGARDGHEVRESRELHFLSVPGTEVSL